MTRQTTLESVCPMFGDLDCRFLSKEKSLRLFTKIEPDPTTKMYKPVGMGSRNVVLGMYCNNHSLKQSGWIDTMTYCPKLWALHRGVTNKEGKKK